MHSNIKSAGNQSYLQKFRMQNFCEITSQKPLNGNMTLITTR